MQYIAVSFTYGYKGLGLQEVDDTGNVVRHTDILGNTLALPLIYECKVVDNRIGFPLWGTKSDLMPTSFFGTTKVGEVETKGSK